MQITSILRLTYCECETKSSGYVCAAGKLYRAPGAGPFCQKGGAENVELNILVQSYILYNDFQTQNVVEWQCKTNFNVWQWYMVRTKTLCYHVGCMNTYTEK